MYLNSYNLSIYLFIDMCFYRKRRSAGISLLLLIIQSLQHLSLRTLTTQAPYLPLISPPFYQQQHHRQPLQQQWRRRYCSYSVDYTVSTVDEWRGRKISMTAPASSRARLVGLIARTRPMTIV